MDMGRRQMGGAHPTGYEGDDRSEDEGVCGEVWVGDYSGDGGVGALHMGVCDFVRSGFTGKRVRLKTAPYGVQLARGTLCARQRVC